MTLRQEILVNGTGPLYADLPEGRASSTPAWAVFRADADEDISATNEITDVIDPPALETNPNTTVDATSGAGESDPTKIFLTATTGCARGRRFLLTSTTGEREWVEVKEVAAGDYIRARSPLRNTYLTGSTFVSTRTTAAVQAAWSGDESNISEWCAGHAGYRVSLRYTVDGISYARTFFFDLVWYPRQNVVTALDVETQFAGWLDRLPIEHQEDQGEAIVANAYEAVRMDALGDGQALRRMRDTEVLAELVRCRANLLAAELAVLRANAPQAVFDVAKKKYDQRYNQLLREPKVPFAVADGGAAAPARRLPVWRR